MARAPDRYLWDYNSLTSVCRGVPKSAVGEWTIGQLIELSGLPDNNLRQHQTRGEFDPHDITTLPVFLARRAKIELRQRLVRLVFSKPRSPKPSPPKSLAGLVEWMTEHGSIEYRRKVLLGALGSERKKRGKKRKTRSEA